MFQPRFAPLLRNRFVWWLLPERPLISNSARRLHWQPIIRVSGLFTRSRSFWPGKLRSPLSGVKSRKGRAMKRDRVKTEISSHTRPKLSSPDSIIFQSPGQFFCPLASGIDHCLHGLCSYHEPKPLSIWRESPRRECSKTNHNESIHVLPFSPLPRALRL